MTNHKKSMTAIAALAVAMFHTSAFAQTATPASAQPTGAPSTTDALTQDVVVTATKKSNGETAQKTPLAITAFGKGQLEALQLHDVSALAFQMPNVQLADVGTSKGVANFTIRGIGVNSSIPSVDPAVGVFVDGVYLGVNTGVVFDTFDLGSVEVLRGPQGVLFGRNVTGGAVVINSTDPSDTLKENFTLKAESGLLGTGGSYTGSGVVTGPLVKGVLDAKLAVYYNDDDGWFKNLYNNQNFGKSKTRLIRSALKFSPSADVTDTLKYEHGHSDGDGPAAQSHTNGYGVPAAYANFSRDTFGFSIAVPGYSDATWDQVTNDTEIRAGNGKISNILAWRHYTQSAESDIAAQPADLFNGLFGTQQSQVSDELRYAGKFGSKFDFTTGLYYFAQRIRYAENRLLFGGLVTENGGGVQTQYTLGAFASGTYKLTDALALDLGARYSYDRKHDNIANEVENYNNPCNVLAGTCTYLGPLDVNNHITSEPTFSPKVGLDYDLSSHARLYTDWARSFRAGGCNFRSTSVNPTLPACFGEEKVDNFELGFKSEPYRHARFNIAAFYTLIDGIQRELNFPDPASGVVQAIVNAGNARIYGLEGDFALPLGTGVTLDGSASYTNGKYTSLNVDLANPANAGSIPASDYALKIPRLVPFTANIGLTAEEKLPVIGTTTMHVSYAHQDAAAYSDDNAGYLNAVNRIDFSLSVKILEGKGAVTLYGQNITNNVQFGGDTQLPAKLGPAPLGGTFSPLNKGRVFGIELRFGH